MIDTRVANRTRTQPVVYGFARLAHGKVIPVSVPRTVIDTRVANCTRTQAVVHGFARLAHGKVVSVSVLTRRGDSGVSRLPGPRIIISRMA